MMPDREKVIKETEDGIAFAESRGFGGLANTMRDTLAMLKEQETKTAHWVSVNDGDAVAIDNDGFPERACYCSECQKYLIASDEYAVYGRYCPYCGSKMEGR